MKLLQAVSFFLVAHMAAADDGEKVKLQAFCGAETAGSADPLSGAGAFCEQKELVVPTKEKVCGYAMDANLSFGEVATSDEGTIDVGTACPPPNDPEPPSERTLNQCPQYSKAVEDDVELDPAIPEITKCQLKRKDVKLKYEPNFPQDRPDVYIEVEVYRTGERFQFYPSLYEDNGDQKTGLIPVDNQEVFDILFKEQDDFGGQGFKMRYISKIGPGEWNSCSYSPIAFDLNRDGTVGHIVDTEVGYHIDITGDGEIEHLSEWFAPNEGILIDAHNVDGLNDYSNGIITGDHLMGDMAGTYTDGFAKLKTYDENCDGKLTGNELDGLFIWVDKDSNLQLDSPDLLDDEEGELFTLGHFGIVALNTIHDDLKSYAELADGSEMLMHDLWFDGFEERRLKSQQAQDRHLKAKERNLKSPRLTGHRRLLEDSAPVRRLGKSKESKKSKDSKVPKSKDSKVQKSKDSKVQKSKDSKVQKSKDSKVQKSKDSKAKSGSDAAPAAREECEAAILCGPSVEETPVQMREEVPESCDVPGAPPMIRNDFDLQYTLFGAPVPDCDDLGQEQSFQGQDLRKANGECFRINICHGTAGGGPGVYKWNQITTGRSQSGNGGLPGHRGENHNTYDGKGKLPDYYPGQEAVPNPNGAGKYYGSMDEFCGFVPHPCESEPTPSGPECSPEVECPDSICDEEGPFACPEFTCVGGECVESDPSCSPDTITCDDGSKLSRDLPGCGFDGECPDSPDAPAPRNAPDDFTDEDKKTGNSFTKGDPHFKTHGGEMYDFHGGCDLVLMDNPHFKNDMGMIIHIRTKIETWWSFVESSVVRIGDETFELVGGSQAAWLYINGVPNEPLEDQKWYETKLAGMTLRYKKSGLHTEAHLYFGDGEKLMMKSYQDFVKVEIAAHGSKHYDGSLGLLGRFPDGKRVGRDGETIIEDVNEFGQGWQVQTDEPKLFHSYDGAVLATQQCAMPNETKEKRLLRQRRLASGLSMEAAEEACSGLDTENERKACVFDVIATQDLNMASVW